MIYVMSDIHGNMRRFRSVMAQIDLQPEDTLYVLGDVMDRFPDGVAILRELMSMPNAKLLLGNHGHMMLEVMDPETVGKLSRLARWQARVRWNRNEGEVTQRALEALSKEERERIYRFVRTLPLSYALKVNGKSFRLIHAAPSELYEEHRGEYPTKTQFAVWHRWPLDEEYPEATDDVFIFGHTPTCYFSDDAGPLRIFYRENRIGIDCGSGFPENVSAHSRLQGRLACLRLDDMKEYYSEEAFSG